MSRTTIEVTQERKEQLRDARLSHESNYDETIERLLGESDSAYATESEVRDIVREMVMLEALE